MYRRFLTLSSARYFVDLERILFLEKVIKIILFQDLYASLKKSHQARWVLQKKVGCFAYRCARRLNAFFYFIYR